MALVGALELLLVWPVVVRLVTVIVVPASRMVSPKLVAVPMTISASLETSNCPAELAVRISTAPLASIKMPLCVDVADPSVTPPPLLLTARSNNALAVPMSTTPPLDVTDTPPLLLTSESPSTPVPAIRLVDPVVLLLPKLMPLPASTSSEPAVSVPNSADASTSILTLPAATMLLVALVSAVAVIEIFSAEDRLAASTLPAASMTILAVDVGAVAPMSVVVAETIETLPSLSINVS